MAIGIKPLVSPALAGCCSIFSIFGVVILCAFGYFYSIHSEALTGSTEDAPDADKVAKACYAAAIIYAAFVGFCGLQMVVHRRFPRGVQLS